MGLQDEMVKLLREARTIAVNDLDLWRRSNTDGHGYYPDPDDEAEADQIQFFIERIDAVITKAGL